MFYRLEPRFEIMSVFVVVFVLFVLFLFLIFLCFCLDKCFSMIWMIDDSALYIECQSRVWRYA